MKVIRFIVLGATICVLTSSCTAINGFIDGFDTPPEMTSPCVGAQDSPCGPKRTPEQQWLMNHHYPKLAV